jgi:hypothetical protein
MSVSFSTNIYEETYKKVLLEGFLQNQLDLINYPFDKKIITINNVDDKNNIIKIIEKNFKEFEYYFTDINNDFILKEFSLQRDSLDPGYLYSIHHFFQFYYSQCEYNFHLSADCPIKLIDNNFIDKSIKVLDSISDVITVMPSWDFSFLSPKEESEFETEEFYYAKGFTDQVYFCKLKDFKKDIYNYTHPLSERYPQYASNAFERRIDSYMQTCGKYRAICKKSYYTHEGS